MRYIFIFGISLFILVSASCKKDETTPESITKANITGSVKLFDESKTELNGDGMTISIDESDPIISTISNTDGTFTFENIEFGSYDLVYNRTGFGTYKIFGITNPESIDSDDEEKYEDIILSVGILLMGLFKSKGKVPSIMYLLHVKYALAYIASIIPILPIKTPLPYMISPSNVVIGIVSIGKKTQ